MSHVTQMRAARQASTEPLVAIGMTRVSLPGQVDNYSIETQHGLLNSFGQKHGFTIPEGMMLDDGGFSGTRMDRPSIRRALRLIHEGKAQAVVFPYVDRFSRNVEAGLWMIRQFREAGAEVFVGELGWYKDDLSFKLQLTLHLGIAEMQRGLIVQKSRECVLTKIDRNLAHGGVSPYGYRFMSGLELAAEALARGEKIDTRAKPQNVHRRDEGECAALLTMHLLCQQGLSTPQICAELMTRGIMPRRAAQWAPGTVLGYLKDEIYYTGIWSYNKRAQVTPKTRRIRDIEGRQKLPMSQVLKPRSEWRSQKLPGAPLITKECWDATQAALERTKQTKRGRPAAAGNAVNLLRSLVRCALCGKAVVQWQKRNREGRANRWYQCCHRDRITGKRLCDAQSIQAERLEGAVWEGAKGALTTYRLDAMIDEHRTAMTEDKADAAELARLQDEAARLQRKWETAAQRELMEDDAERQQFYAGMARDLKGQLALVKRRLQVVQAEAEHGGFAVDVASIRRAAIAAFRTTVPEERQAILVKFVDHVTYADCAATIWLRVPLAGANLKQDESPVTNYILLKTKVAA